jgi:hypothetical protein
LEVIATSQVPAFTLIREERSLQDLPQVLQEMLAGSVPPKTAILPKLPAGVRLSMDELEEFSGDWKVA